MYSYRSHLVCDSCAVDKEFLIKCKLMNVLYNLDELTVRPSFFHKFATRNDCYNTDNVNCR